MEYLLGYIAAIFFFQILLVFTLDNRYEMREFIIATYFWPIVLFAVLFMIGFEKLLNKIKWDADIKKGEKIFRFRKPLDNWPGFAITIFYIEFQFWKKRD